MSGAGIFLDPTEKDPIRQNHAIRQLMEGRSNAVGSCTLATGSATTTTVIAVTCGPNAWPHLEPMTANAAAARQTTFVSSVTPGQFIVSHSSTSSIDVTFRFFCVG